MSNPQTHSNPGDWFACSEIKEHGGQRYAQCAYRAFVRPDAGRHAFSDWIAWGEKELGDPVVFYDDGEEFHLYPRLDVHARLAEILKGEGIDAPRRTTREGDASGDASLASGC